SAYLRIAGSYNIIEHVIARNNDDTGISISAKDKDRLLWPAHNLVLNSDSYNNLDLSGINADGFAAKLGVGPGNIFRGCIAHNNADDGWDLFNKIEDGPNASVT
ncbi:right-handed parallel beta-helix repeat-containing protein, partial [Escherichia coli]